MNTFDKQISRLGAIALPTLAGAFLLVGVAGAQSPDLRRQSGQGQGQAGFTPPLSAARNDSNESLTRVSVTFSGGYETDPRDRGRPVVLIAAALGVPSEVFRATFRNVSPAPAGHEPDPAQVNRNKQALLQGLGPYGVTNERLDTVSNFYRYNAGRGEMWRNAPASAYAMIRNGKVVSFAITNPGFGYSSAPRVYVPGASGVRATAVLAYTSDFRTNGSLKGVTLGGSDAPDSRSADAGSSGRQNDSGAPIPEAAGAPNRPDRPGRPGGRGPRADLVPGDMLVQYLGLSPDQKVKLDRLIKVMDVLRRENFALPEVAQLKLTDDQIRNIAEGSRVKDVLTAEQNRVLAANPRPAIGGPGAPPPPPR